MAEIVEACIKLGAPVAALSWFLFTWLHGEGKLNITADQKTIDADLKRMKKSLKSEKAARAKERKRNKPPLKQRLRNLNFMSAVDSSESETTDKVNYIFERWMWFGSGFYGLSALWTLVIIEIQDIFRFIFNFPGFAKLFENGVVQLVVDFIVNQFHNILGAFLWFNYWSNGFVFTWMVVAYVGYMVGIKVAKFQQK